jgi:signal transduction histidine kinase
LGNGRSELLGPFLSILQRTKGSAGTRSCFTKDTAYLIEQLSEFIGGALRAGDPAIVIGTAKHRDGLAESLCRQGLDVGAYTRAGSYVEMDAGSALLEFMMDGAPDPERFYALVDDLFERVEKKLRRGRPVAVFGEMVALLWKAGEREAAIGLEDLWNTAATRHALSLLCAYPFDLFPEIQDEVSFGRICDCHDAIRPGEDYAQLAGAGERLREVAAAQQRSFALETLRAFRNSEDPSPKQSEEESLRRFSLSILRGQEEERRRVGEELLEILGQYLSVLNMKLDAMRPSAQGRENAAEEEFETCVHLVDESIKEVRTLSYLLYPPLLEEAGLSLAIPWYLSEFTKRSGIKTELFISPGFRRLSNDADVALFRILQEALSNVQRHSGSATAEVRLLANVDSVALVVGDAGKGLPAEVLHPNQGGLVQMGMGIRSMTERARILGGRLEMASSGKGVTITATIPVPFCGAAAASA